MKITKALLTSAIVIGISACGSVEQTVEPKTQMVQEKSYQTELGTIALNSIKQRVESRSYPSVFQAWNPLDTAEFPLDTLENRLTAAAKHDLLWEEPVSQISFNTPLVLGTEWNHKHTGLADGFDPKTYQQALINRAKLLEKNPNMVMLMEVRWRDAPGSYLPEDSEYWLRNDDGSRVAGWKGGPEPYYMLNYENKAFQHRVAQMSKIAVNSGVYDGVMFDWSGHLDIIKLTRAAIGDKALITVNIHDYLNKAEKYQEYINGAFMECDPDHSYKPLCTWDGMKQAIDFYELKFKKPVITGVEAWGDRQNEKTMRAITTLALTHSNGYVLFADPNPLKTPDHLHNWYDMWDFDLGKPTQDGMIRPDGASQRQFENALVVYNPQDNEKVTVKFKNLHKRFSDGREGYEFVIKNVDGDIFSPVKH